MANRPYLPSQASGAAGLAADIDPVTGVITPKVIAVPIPGGNTGNTIAPGGVAPSTGQTVSPTYDASGRVLLASDDVLAAMYSEMRVQTLLLLQMVTFLSTLIGPAAPINGWTPLDLTNELDQWRNDPDMILN